VPRRAPPAARHPGWLVPGERERAQTPARRERPADTELDARAAAPTLERPVPEGPRGRGLSGPATSAVASIGLPGGLPRGAALCQPRPDAGDARAEPAPRPLADATRLRGRRRLPAQQAPAWRRGHTTGPRARCRRPLFRAPVKARADPHAC